MPAKKCVFRIRFGNPDPRNLHVLWIHLTTEVRNVGEKPTKFLLKVWASQHGSPACKVSLEQLDLFTVVSWEFGTSKQSQTGCEGAIFLVVETVCHPARSFCQRIRNCFLPANVVSHPQRSACPDGWFRR